MTLAKQIMPRDSSLTIIVIALCSSVMLYDLRYRRVPNELVTAGLVAPLIMFAVAGAGYRSILVSQALSGALIAFISFLPFYVLRKMGAGDVKFFTALGLWLGVEPLLPIFIIGSLLGGLQAAITLLLRSPVLHGMPGGALISRGSERASSLLQGWSFANRGIPYAAWLAVGAMAWLFHQPT